MIAVWSVAALALERPNIVLISLDTTRADALSCYGVPEGPYLVNTITTPNIDALALRGIRFEHFFAHAPSTLSSHASMLTGLDPHGHAVVRNGFPLVPSHPTLAESLSAAGWETMAVVGSSALESAMGLQRGFHLYDDVVTDISGITYQASADNVVSRVFTALDHREDTEKPLFLMAHFYDPHAPYEPPEPFRSRYVDPRYTGNVRPEDPASFKAFASLVRRNAADPADISHVSNLYLGEVAFVDDQVGVLLGGLSERGILEHAIVIIVADHGETLADESMYAWSHGSNVAYEVMHVPLVVVGYGMPLAQRAVIARQAGMSSLAPTILDLVGLPPIGEGLSLAGWLRAGPALDAEGWPEHPTVPVYVEATRPRYAESADRWNNLFMHRGVWAGGYGIVSAPFLVHPSRFYEQSAPPDEGVRAILERMVFRWDKAAPEHVAGSDAPSTTRALKALGYVE